MKDLKQIQAFLQSHGFAPNAWDDAWDKGDFRVYFVDYEVHVVKFDNPVTQLVEWENVIDGNMHIDETTSLISLMTD